MKAIYRDPFARRTDWRRSVVVGICGPTCAWCGSHGRQLRPSDKNGHDDPRRLFRYGSEHDGNRGITWDERMFCSRDCYRQYYY